MTRKNIGWSLIIASFVIGYIGKGAIFTDILTLGLVITGGIIVWQENGKIVKASKEASKE